MTLKHTKSIIPVALVVIWLFGGLYAASSPVFFISKIIYATNNIVLIMLATYFLVQAYKFNTKSPLKEKIYLAFFSLLICFVLFDYYVLFYRFDTNGPGSSRCYTHKNWINTCVNNNSSGFADRDFDECKDSHLKIIAVGDSFTWGQGVQNFNDRFSNRIEAILNARGNQVCVLNLGIGGADTKSELNTFNKVGKALRPNIVLICYLTNDIDPSDVFTSELPQLAKPLVDVSEISPFINFLYWKFVGPSSYQLSGMKYIANILYSYMDEIKFSEHIKELNIFVEEIRSVGATPVIVLLPFPMMWTLVDNSIQDKVYRKLSSSMKNLGVPVIDLSDLNQRITPQEFAVNPMDSHPNETSHGIIADRIANYLVEHGIVKDLQ